MDPEVKCLESLENSVADSSYVSGLSSSCPSMCIAAKETMYAWATTSSDFNLNLELPGVSGKMPPLAGDPFVSQEPQHLSGLFVFFLHF